MTRGQPLNLVSTFDTRVSTTTLSLQVGDSNSDTTSNAMLSENPHDGWISSGAPDEWVLGRIIRAIGVLPRSD